MKLIVTLTLGLAATILTGQTLDWHHTFQTANAVNPYHNQSNVCASADGYWFAYVADHHVNYHYSHGDVAIHKFDADGEIALSSHLAGNAHVAGMIERQGNLYLWVNAYEHITLNDSMFTFPNQLQHIFCRLDASGTMTYLPFYGDTISAWTVNARGEYAFVTTAGFGGDVKLYEVSGAGNVLREKALPGLGYVFTISEKTNGDGYIIGGGCMSTVDIDSVHLEPVDEYTNYLISLDSTLTVRRMRAIEDISCVVNQVWSDGATSYYAGMTAIRPTFDGLPFDGPAGMGYDFFLSRLDDDSFTWVRETPGSAGWHGAQLSHRQGMAVDEAGNMYVFGHQRGEPITWAPGLVTGNPDNSEELFILSYNPAGNLRWAKGFGGKQVDYAMGIAATGVDELIITAVIADTLLADGQVIPAEFGTTWVAKIAANTTNVDQPIEFKNVMTHPNPATDIVQVRLPLTDTETTIQVYDAAGRPVHHKTTGARAPEDAVTLDLSGQPPGLYIIIATSGPDRWMAKVILQP